MKDRTKITKDIKSFMTVIDKNGNRIPANTQRTNMTFFPVFMSDTKDRDMLGSIYKTIDILDDDIRDLKSEWRKNKDEDLTAILILEEVRKGLYDYSRTFNHSEELAWRKSC